MEQEWADNEIYEQRMGVHCGEMIEFTQELDGHYTVYLEGVHRVSGTTMVGGS